jgi:hypothetical protein
MRHLQSIKLYQSIIPCLSVKPTYQTDRWSPETRLKNTNWPRPGKCDFRGYREGEDCALCENEGIPRFQEAQHTELPEIFLQLYRQGGAESWEKPLHSALRVIRYIQSLWV